MTKKHVVRLALVLGCHGKSNKFGDINFVGCTGTENIIIYFDDIRHENISNITNYFSRIAKVFDEIVYDTNIIANAIHYLYNQNAIDKALHSHIINWFGLHKRCGFFLMTRDLSECI